MQVLEGIVDLCRVQEERLHEESSSIVAERSYETGTLTLGIGFFELPIFRERTELPRDRRKRMAILF